MNKSLFLLYSFAYGAVLEKMPGMDSLTEKMHQYLENQDIGLEPELKKSIPQLIIAWNHLRKESKATGRDLLDFRLVQDYVYKKHNGLMPIFCAVKAARIIKIDQTKRTMTVLNESDDKKIRVKFLPRMAKKLKPGDSIAIHYNWLVSKINPSQRHSLLKNRGLDL